MIINIQILHRNSKQRILAKSVFLNVNSIYNMWYIYYENIRKRNNKTMAIIKSHYSYTEDISVECIRELSNLLRLLERCFWAMNHTIITKRRAATTQQLTTTIATIHYSFILVLPIDHNPRISYSQIHSPSGL